MNTARNKGLLRYAGLVFLILGLIIALYHIPQATQYSTDSHLLDTLRYVCLGIALEIFGLGLVIVDRK
jgi:disulfide bond formation protein DsbB